MKPLIFHTIKELQPFLNKKRDSQIIGFVPTMGALHAGHLSLVELAVKHSNSVGVSIFVNPTQFLPGEDFSKYPRTVQQDIEALTKTPCEWVFIPEDSEMYPPGADSRVDSGGIGTILEGAFRPGHFTGITTIVMRLFQIVQPNVAVFGQKDAQQCAIIKKMVRDFVLPIEIQIGATVRESDGLAYSSRNRYLSNDDRSRANGLFHSLQTGLKSLLVGDGFVSAESTMYKTMHSYRPDRIDYLTFVDDASFGPPIELKTVRAVGAIRFGATRLIDNLSVEELTKLL